MGKSKPGGKHCPGCDKTKPIGEFPRNAGGGRRQLCRACTPPLPAPAWKQAERSARVQRQGAIREAAVRKALKAQAEIAAMLTRPEPAAPVEDVAVRAPRPNVKQIAMAHIAERLAALEVPPAQHREVIRRITGVSQMSRLTMAHVRAVEAHLASFAGPDAAAQWLAATAESAPVAAEGAST